MIVLEIVGILVFSIVASSYSPNEAVLAAHNIPHLNSQLRAQSNEFSVSSDYFESVLVFPVLLGATGLFAIAIYLFCLALRLCVTGIRFEPTATSTVRSFDQTQFYEWSKGIILQKRLLLGGTIIFLIFLVVSTNFVFFSDNSLTKGVNRVSDGLVSLVNVFDSITTACNSIISEAQTIANLLAQSTCQYLSSYDINSYLNLLESSVQQILDDINRISNYLSEAKDYVRYYGIYVKNWVLYISYSIFMLLVVLFIIGAYLQNRIITKITIGLMTLVTILMTVICTIEMIFVTIMADVCMDPAGNVAELFPAGTGRDVITYYLTCEGTNPLQSSINNATYYANYLNQTLYALSTGATAPCPGDPYITASYPYMNEIFVNIDDIVALTDCTTVYNIWYSTVNDGVCYFLFRGFFSLWISEYVSSGCIFFILLFACFLYYYYGTYWSERTLVELYEGGANQFTISNSSGLVIARPVSMREQNTTATVIDGVYLQEVNGYVGTNNPINEVIPSAPPMQ